LFQKGFKLFGQDKFKLWIRTPNKVIDNNTPIEIMDTSIGIEMIEDIIGRIEHGVYS
jgi:putative toxin-antitoxin system antitoxin component (TIGR02293 family)